MGSHTLPIVEADRVRELYEEQHLSARQVANQLGCSANKINYWLKKYGIRKRSISDAVYLKRHPNGDPFAPRHVRNINDAKLLGLGMGLYWGEGTKASKHSVRLGNTDPQLLKTFIEFLTELFGVPKENIRFGLQLFTDIDAEEALQFWVAELGVERSQFYKIHVTISGSIGTYRKKSRYGVVTIYYNNKKLRDLLVGMLPR